MRHDSEPFQNPTVEICHQIDSLEQNTQQNKHLSKLSFPPTPISHFLDMSNEFEASRAQSKHYPKINELTPPLPPALKWIFFENDAQCRFKNIRKLYQQ